MGPLGRPEGEYRSAKHGGSRARAWLRRAPWEQGTAGLIALGLVMLMQPFAMEVYTYSFVVLLAGVIGYSIAVKLPEH
jgi:hypothetical protein